MENSTLAVAAVGLCGAPINLIICVSAGFFIGSTATIAWHQGAKETEKTLSVAYQSMLIALGIATVFALVSYTAARPIMTFVCGSSEALETAVLYYRINAIGFFFQIITANITACFRGVGITRMPMIYNLIGGVANVGMNYLLIYGKLGFPAMGVAGAAWATTLSKAVTLVIAVLVLFLKKSPIQYKKGIRMKPERSIFSRLLPVGLTSAGEQLILQCGATVTAKIISVLPTNSIAANQVVNNLEAFAWSTGGACNAASTTLFGQSMGAGDEQRARRYLRLTLYWAWGFAAAEMLIMCFAGRPLAMAFTNDSVLYPIIQQLLVIFAMALPFINSHQSISGALRGAGDSVAPLIASLISLWIFRVGGGYLTIRLLDWGVEAYRWSMALDQAVRCAAVTIFYLTGHWKRHLRREKE